MSIAAGSHTDCLAADSSFSSGKWVKIEVGQEGVYGIPYSELREMGFSNPSSVAVFGKGGGQLPMNFTTISGTVLYDNALPELNVLHSGGTLYFYGTGPDEVEINSKGRYERINKNIYSDKGYYFLYEKPTAPLSMSRNVNPSGRIEDISSVRGFVYHEEDLSQNNTGTGQLFWGESFLGPENKHQSWELEMPGMTEGSTADIKCAIYVENGTTGTISYGIEDAGGNPSFKITKSSNSSFRIQEPSECSVIMSSGSPVFYVDFGGAGGSFANLDYWLVNYPRTAPSLTDSHGNRISQERFGVSAIGKGASGRFYLGGEAGGAVVIDVTDRTSPFVVSKGGTVIVEGGSGPRDLVAFDPSKEQLRISGYKRMENSDIPRKVSDGADFLIIAVPRLKAYAEKLAELHKKYDGIETLVVTPEEVYDTYSGGVPDPMAYRAIVCEMYDNPGRRLRNLLLMGPMFGDFRGRGIERDPFSCLIAFQNPQISHGKETANANDFYGMTDRYLNLERIETGSMDVGVGVLPCYDTADAATYIGKVEKYLKGDGLAYTVNETFTIGGLGDNHTHDKQALDIASLFGSVSEGKVVNSGIIIDVLGNESAKKSFMDALERGKAMGLYIGHGGPTMLGKDKNFFTTGEALSLRNDKLSFMLFAGCTLSELDKGKRGLGEIMVLGTDYGLIGSILATRSVWSGQNFDFSKRFFTRLFRNSGENSPMRSSTPTIGEVYAASKKAGSYSNDLSFQLICDPALRIFLSYLDIVPDSGMSHSIKPGNPYTITAKVYDSGGSFLRDFNGKAVIKLMEPETIRELEGNVTGDPVTDNPVPTIRYADRLVKSYEADINNGMLSTSILVPSGMDLFSGQNAVLYISAYDPDFREGAGGKLTVNVEEAENPGENIMDELPPSISDVSFDITTSTLSFSVSDNEPFRLTSTSLGVRVDDSYYSGIEVTSRPTGSELREYLCGIQLIGLEEGAHEVDITAKDMSGNTSTLSSRINVAAPEARIRLAMSEPVVDKEVDFSVATDVAGEEMTVNVMDTEGNVRAKITLIGGKAQWKGEDSDGKRLAPGLYRAVAVSASAWSEPIYVPVL